MALDFPASPSVGQKYPVPPVAGVPVYSWDGEKWTTIGGAMGSTGASDAIPTPDTATGGAGSSTLWSRGDHAHPQDPLKSNITYVDTQDALKANITYVDTQDALKVNKAGDTMSGGLSATTIVSTGEIYTGNATANNGVLRFGSNGAQYLVHDGAKLTSSHTLSSLGNVNVAGVINVTGAIACSDPGTGLAIQGYTSPSPFQVIICQGNPNWNAVWFQALHYVSVWAGARISCGGTSFDFYGGGGAFKPGGGPWSDNSDARIKNVLGDYMSGLDAVAALKPVRFTYKGNETISEPAHLAPGEKFEEGKAAPKEAPTVPYKNSTHYNAAVAGKEFIGLVAQDVEPTMPELVTKHGGYIDGVAVDDLHDLDTGPLIFALINAVKELKARVEQLESGG